MPKMDGGNEGQWARMEDMAELFLLDVCCAVGWCCLSVWPHHEDFCLPSILRIG